MADSHRLLVADELDQLRYVSDEQRYAAVGMQAEGQHPSTVLAYLLSAAGREKQRRMKLILDERTVRREQHMASAGPTTPVGSRTGTPVGGRASRQDESVATATARDVFGNIRASSEQRRSAAQTKRNRMLQYSPSHSMLLHVAGAGGGHATRNGATPPPCLRVDLADVMSPTIPPPMALCHAVGSSSMHETSASNSAATTPRRLPAAGGPTATTPSRLTPAASGYGASAVSGRSLYPAVPPHALLPPPFEPPADHHNLLEVPGICVSHGSRSPSPRDPNPHTKQQQQRLVAPGGPTPAVQLVPPLVLAAPKLRPLLPQPAPLQAQAAAEGAVRGRPILGSAMHPSPRAVMGDSNNATAASSATVLKDPAPVGQPHVQRAISPHRTAKWIEDFHQRLDELDLTLPLWLQLSPGERDELFVFWRLTQLQRNVILAKFGAH